MADPTASEVRRVRAAGADQRKWARYPSSPQTRCQVVIPDLGTEAMPGTIRNLSAGGISVLVGRRIPLGELANIHLENPSRHFACDVQLRVIYTIQDPSGDFLVGGPFDRELSHDDLEKLL